VAGFAVSKTKSRIGVFPQNSSAQKPNHAFHKQPIWYFAG
jgi:hypothetical protein